MACSSQTAPHPTRVQLCPTSLRGPGSLHHRAPPTPRSPQEPGCPTALQLSPSSSSQPATARPATQPLTTATLFVQHGFSRFPSALSLSNCRFGYPAAGGRHLWVCIPLRPKVLNRRSNVLVFGQGRGYVVRRRSKKTPGTFQMARLFSMHRSKVQGSVSKSLVYGMEQ